MSMPSVLGGPQAGLAPLFDLFALSMPTLRRAASDAHRAGNPPLAHLVRQPVPLRRLSIRPLPQLEQQVAQLEKQVVQRDALIAELKESLEQERGQVAEQIAALAAQLEAQKEYCRDRFEEVHKRVRL